MKRKIIIKGEEYLISEQEFDKAFSVEEGVSFGDVGVDFSSPKSSFESFFGF